MYMQCRGLPALSTSDADHHFLDRCNRRDSRESPAQVPIRVVTD